MKLENNWRHKTLENLEKTTISKSTYDSHLVRRCTELYKIPLDQFTTEDLRIMIGQQIGLKFLMPLAIETLSQDLFAEGNLYEGDLLKSVLSVDTVFWDNNKECWQNLNELIKDRRQDIKKAKFDTINFDNFKKQK
ncbi:MAG: hypothetical protein KIT62_01225 [Cyclobacteriaceae bacterium]|nr:hypothetical protein [Cyclobacteriaceae bacterium]